ncbi:MAG: TIGR00730 family Rossman fold protein [Anaerolineaceae bacterium]|nr:TIGR00730 family Rossman fold protein [Anaerolineaceae bacterium]
MKKIAVYCGSNKGARVEYVQAAKEFAKSLVGNGLGMVYGGGSTGIMGEVADAVIQMGGEVIGVTPRMFVDMDIIHPDLTELHVVDTMHERKSLIVELADGFIALPGGIGTFEEIFEVLTWAQLGIHAKPCGLLNICGYYEKIIEMLDHAVTQRFVSEIDRERLLVDENPAKLLKKFENYKSPGFYKLIY